MVEPRQWDEARVDWPQNRPARPAFGRVIAGVVVLLLAISGVIFGSALFLREAAGNPSDTWRRLEEAMAGFELDDTYQLVREDRKGVAQGFAGGDYPRVNRTYVSSTQVGTACIAAFAAFDEFASQVEQTGSECSYQGSLGEFTTSLQVSEASQLGSSEPYVSSNSRVDVSVSSGG